MVTSKHVIDVEKQENYSAYVSTRKSTLDIKFTVYLNNITLKFSW